MKRDLKQDFDALLTLYPCVVLSTGMRTAEVSHDEAVQKTLIEAVAVKLFWHLVALRRLSDGSSVGTEGVLYLRFTDFPSMAVLARAALETYFAFHFLFVGCRADAEVERLRNLVWQLDGLKTRQGLPGSQPESVAKLEAEKQTIGQIEETLQHLSAFQKLSGKEKANALAGRWRAGGWARLADSADIYKRGIKPLYSYLSAHCHTDYLSAIQVRSASREAANQEKWSRMYVALSLMLMSHFITDYSARFPETRAVIEADPAGAQCVSVWLMRGLSD